MFSSAQMRNQYIQERNEKIKHQETTDKTVSYSLYRQKTEQSLFHSKIMITGNSEYCVYSYIIEFNLQQEFKELPYSYMRLTHKVASYQDKAIYACLPPHTKDVEEQTFATHRILYQLIH